MGVGLFLKAQDYDGDKEDVCKLFGSGLELKVLLSSEAFKQCRRVTSRHNAVNIRKTVAHAFPLQKITRLSMDDSLAGAVVQEPVPAPGHAMTQCEDASVTELKQSFAGILKYLGQMDTTLRQIETSLRNAEQAGNTGNTGVIEIEAGNTGVTDVQKTEFKRLVQIWDIEGMINMIRDNRQLMLKTFAWGEFRRDFVLGRVSSIFQLAIIVNSEHLVAKMLEIAPPEILDPFKVTLSDDALNEDFLVSPSKLGSVMHGGIGHLLGTATQEGVGVFPSLDGIPQQRRWAEEQAKKQAQEQARKQDLLDALVPIMSENFEAFLQGDSLAERTIGAVGKTVREELFQWGTHKLQRTNYSESGLWWGTPFGISLGDDDNLFVLHFLAAQFLDSAKFKANDFTRFFVLFAEHLRPALSVLKKVCEKLGPDYTTRLLNLTDHNGETPVHIAFSKFDRDFDGWLSAFADFIHVMTESSSVTDRSILDVRDSAGMNILHVAVANGRADQVKQLAEIDGFKDLVDARFSKSKLTALHLAVIHNEIDCVKVLMEKGCKINQPAELNLTKGRADGEISGYGKVNGAFQLAAILGRVQILQAMLKDGKLWDSELINRPPLHRPLSSYEIDRLLSGPPALHLAVHSGNPLAVKTLLDSGRIDPFATHAIDGSTALHYVAEWAEVGLQVTNSFFGGDMVKFCKFMQSGTFDGGQKKNSLGTLIGSIELLMQAGLDMDQKSDRGQTPQLRTSAPDELTRWWYDKMARQTQETKENLVAASTAVSVTAALVATASFVGPLQPPLGLSTSADTWLTGYSQVNHSAVQVFLFCDGLSFYLAMASIMLAVIPSLTIPREGLQLEVRIANRVVQISVVLLFASITFVICAFGAASIAIVPESHWLYKAVVVVTTIVGSSISFTALGLFVVRLMRLIRPNYKWVVNLNNRLFPPRKLHSGESL